MPKDPFSRCHAYWLIKPNAKKFKYHQRRKLAENRARDNQAKANYPQTVPFLVISKEVTAQGLIKWLELQAHAVASDISKNPYTDQFKQPCSCEGTCEAEHITAFDVQPVRPARARQELVENIKIAEKGWDISRIFVKGFCEGCGKINSYEMDEKEYSLVSMKKLLEKCEVDCTRFEAVKGQWCSVSESNLQN